MTAVEQFCREMKLPARIYANGGESPTCATGITLIADQGFVLGVVATFPDGKKCFYPWERINAIEHEPEPRP